MSVPSATGLNQNPRPPKWFWFVAFLMAIITATEGFFIFRLLVPPEPNLDDQYSDVCFSAEEHPKIVTSQTQPLTPIGQAADLNELQYTVMAPASSFRSVAGHRAHGTFVTVRIEIQNITSDDTLFDSTDFQLVVYTGRTYCAAQHTSALASIPVSGLTAATVMTPIQKYLSPSGPPVTATLAFDVDPKLVKGAYLLAWDAAGGTASFDLGT